MSNWTGAAAICLSDQNQMLMVLQGKPEEEKTWSVPSGGKLQDESYEECCIRETFEETGYKIQIIEKGFVKNETVHYYFADVIGGVPQIQDPDDLIYDIAWKSAEEIKDLRLSFEEDRKILIELLNPHQAKFDA